jgi:hypothetical protein
MADPVSGLQTNRAVAITSVKGIKKVAFCSATFCFQGYPLWAY